MDLEKKVGSLGHLVKEETRAHAGIDYVAEPGREVVAVTKME